MDKISVTEEEANLFKLVDQTNATNQPILLAGKSGNAVLISESEWNAIQETLYLMSTPGMAESIIEASQTPRKDWVDEDTIRDILNG